MSKKSRVTKVQSQIPVATNLKPIKIAECSIEELCTMEIISEEMDKAEREGNGGVLTMDWDRLQAKIAEKKREKKETGKVSTFLTEGRLATAEQIEEMQKIK
jgi:hypothetical protein